MKKGLLFFAVFWTLSITAQTNIASTNTLKEVVISSSRIDLALRDNDRSITIISKEQIEQSAAPTVVDVLQQVAGIDIRRRGMAGMQADLYIRGGSFDQTLLLIDGVKLDDAQTGHHTLNFALPVEVIERIEIVKGPAARIFGLNAFTGAINIVTKSATKKDQRLSVASGSYQQYAAQLTLAKNASNHELLSHVSFNTSEGYRYNTDFDNAQAFIKAKWNKSTQAPLTFMAMFSDRQFGANGFYALPSYADQYEETQASLLALSTVINKGKWLLKPRIYWRRGQDEYIFVRDNPSIYRNLHITHKVGAALDASFYGDLGETGIGIDLAKVSISSNNLGDRSRFVTTLFAEHRFAMANDRLTFTPGIAVTNYTDFGTQLFPGLDLGYSLNEDLRLYGNIGVTYRIPTFTDLYYSDRTTVGNENLEVEEAWSQELGMRYMTAKTRFSVAAFHRGAKNLIDYIRPSEEDRFQATNIREVNTYGVEFEWQQQFSLLNTPQQLTLGYAYLNDDVDAVNLALSRYTINSLRHHLTANYRVNLSKNVHASVVYKLAQRPLQDQYTVVDASVQWQLKDVQLAFYANNIFNARYSESNLVPMPLGNGLLTARFNF